MTVETWYVLEDGKVVDPQKCEPDASGHLTHGGVRVKVRGDVYHTRNVDPAEATKVAPTKKAMKPETSESKVGYTTREAKASE